MQTTTQLQAPLPTETLPAVIVPKSNGVEAMNAVKFRIPGDVVNRTAAALPDDQREAIKWLAGWARQNNMSLGEIASRVTKPSGEAYSENTFYQVFTGRRNESGVGLSQICEAIRRFRRQIEETTAISGALFIETTLTKELFRICRRAFERHRIYFVFGESQIGKTSALARYAETHNHGETILIRMPTRGAMLDLLEEFALRLGISTQQRRADLKRRIIDSFDEKMLLIVDEIHQGLSVGSERAAASLEFVREIYDRRKCGVVLCGTNLARQAILAGKHAHILRQLWLRKSGVLMLPKEATAQQLDTFARAFGLDPAPDRELKIEHTFCDLDGDTCTATLKENPLKVQNLVIREAGLGQWIRLLEDARDTAREKGQRITWGRVLIAYAQEKAISQALLGSEHATEPFRANS